MTFQEIEAGTQSMMYLVTGILEPGKKKFIVRIPFFKQLRDDTT